MLELEELSASQSIISIVWRAHASRDTLSSKPTGKHKREKMHEKRTEKETNGTSLRKDSSDLNGTAKVDFDSEASGASSHGRSIMSGRLIHASCDSG